MSDVTKVNELASQGYEVEQMLTIERGDATRRFRVFDESHSDDEDCTEREENRMADQGQVNWFLDAVRRPAAPGFCSRFRWRAVQ